MLQKLLGRKITGVTEKDIDTLYKEPKSITDWLQNDQSFKTAFDSACAIGNVLIVSDTEQLLVEGLEDLLRRRIIQRDDIERLLTVWTRSSGRCPKCGNIIEKSAQFCQKCGMELAR